MVCDDVSSDRSVAIVREFAEQTSFQVRVEVNDRNLRSTGNFARESSFARERSSFWPIRTTVWFPNKLAALETALAADPQAGFVFSDAQLVDEGLKPLGYSLWEAIRFWPREQERFRRGQAYECLLRRYRVTVPRWHFG